MNAILILIFILISIFSRLIPHPPNFTPILAIALMTSIYYKHKFSFMIPVAIMLVSDFFIGNYSMAIPVYISILLIFAWA